MSTNIRRAVDDAAIARLACAIYGYAGDSPEPWDHFDRGSNDDGVCWALRRLDGVDVLVLRGSTTLLDWLRDFDFVRNPFRHRDLGAVHAGFFLGMPEMWAEARAMVGANVIVAGHSLGAARAAILTGLMVLDGRPPARRVVFGEPYPGLQNFADLIRAVPAASYCAGDAHGHDLVTDVPFPLPPELPYVRATPLVPVRATPGADIRSRWWIFAYHHMQLYRAALEQHPA